MRTQWFTPDPACNILALGRHLEEILRWLAALDCTDKHNYIHQLRQDGTCKWFPNTDVYEKWRKHGAQFLWLHGKGMSFDTSRHQACQLIDFGHSWLWEVRANVSSYVVHIHFGADSFQRIHD